MICDCMTAHGIRYIDEAKDGRMNAKDYAQALDGDVTDTLNYYNLCHEDVIFQHNNDPKHTAKITKNYLHDEKKYTVLPWQVQYPDLNPIGHIRKQLRLKLAKYKQWARGAHGSNWHWPSNYCCVAHSPCFLSAGGRATVLNSLILSRLLHVLRVTAVTTRVFCANQVCHDIVLMPSNVSQDQPSEYVSFSLIRWPSSSWSRNTIRRVPDALVNTILEIHS